jgi:isocitrate dehydrogenase (NAD+)
VSHPVVLIPGDGIGPEVIDAARRAIDATGAAIEWRTREAGRELYRLTGEALPAGVVDAIRDCGVGLKGPVTTPAGGAVHSVYLTLRRELDLFAGIRPCRTFPGVPGAAEGLDVVVVRMNLEDLYAGIEFAPGSVPAGQLRELVRRANGVEIAPDSGVSIKALSTSAAARLARLAFRYARANGRRKVTSVHKATVMPATDGLFAAAVRAEAERNPELAFEEVLVDTFAAQLVRDPARHDVAVMPVLYGDVISDLAAALAGGPGLAPGANVGDGCALFEAAHGTAPAHVGAGRANPMAAILSGVMLLRHLGEADAADRLERAVSEVLLDGRTLTYDLRGPADRRSPARTAEVADAVIARL